MKKSIILILILVVCIFAFNHFSQNNRNELSELGTHVQNINLEYKSERGFGNDRFDMYSFSIEGKLTLVMRIAILKRFTKKNLEVYSIQKVKSIKN